MRLRTARSLFVALSLVAASLVLRAQSSVSWLGAPQVVAPGVELYTTLDTTLTSPAGATAVYLLRLDPSRVTLSNAHAGDEIMALETVDRIAQRHHAVAAINAGFFNTKNGDPSSVLKIAGEFVSDTSVPRGVVAMSSPATVPMVLTFDQLSAKQDVRFTANGRTWVVPIDGVDTTRELGKLMLYSPMYHADTDTAPTGTEIVASGTPLVVRDVRVRSGHTAIPRDGVVLSYGGATLPESLSWLKPGVTLTVNTNWKSHYNVASSVFDKASAIVNGAGLLRRGGVALTEWSLEKVNETTFVNARHPRTLIGVDDKGFVWLAAVDGRKDGYAVGMTFAELQGLCDRLNLRDALNLDGGGSVTMVVKDRIVNQPSDATGPRPVSDAILVKSRS